MNFEELANNYVSRIVAGVLTPILLPAVTAAAVWVQDVAGVDLHGDQLTGFIVAVAAGLAITAVTWLRNRGAWEVAQAELIKLHELGQQEINRSSGEPSAPVGLAKPE